MPQKKKTAKKAPAKKVAKKATTNSAAKKAAKKTAEKPTPADEAADKAKSPETPAKPVKMTAFIKKQQQRLFDLRDELMEAMYGVQNETIKSATENSDTGNGMHQGDAGSDSYDRDLALSMLAKEQDALSEIEKALERIEKGTYGICEMSGEKIPPPRLEALPFARLTVECQAAWEEEQRNRGVLPGDYGFGAFGDSNRSVSLDASGD